MGHWTELPICSIDFEATGVDPFTVRIVECGVALIAPDGTLIDGWSTVVNCGIDIPDDAAAVHGITTERSKAEGVHPATALTVVADSIANHHADHAGQAAIAFFNARYDLPLLLVEADRHHVDVPPTAGIVDPFVLDKMHDRFRKGSRKLIDTARHYGVPLDESEAHGALADCVAGGRLAFKLAARYPAIHQKSLASLWLDQVRGHEEGRVSFEEYLRRKDPTANIPAGWPLPVAQERAA